MACEMFAAIVIASQVVLILSIPNSNSGDASTYYNSYWSTAPHRQRKILSGDEKNVKVLLEWHVDFERETIIFDLTARTTGYVGFGLKRPSFTSSKPNEGGMAHSDIVIGGIYPNGTSFLTDYHGKDNFTPVRDEIQNVQLLSAYKSQNYTVLRYTRQLITCDYKDDVQIKLGEPLQVMWALGSTDQVTSHGLVQRGIVDSVILVKAPETILLPPPPPPILKGYSSWTVMTNVYMNREYDYRCTFHRGPTFDTDVHAVAFTPILSDPKSSHVHHFTLYQCKIPKGADYDYYNGEYRSVMTFEPLVVQRQGFECYSKDSRIPINLCMQTLYVWSPGENGMYFPDQAGYLLSSETSRTYFMFEVHYENPGEIFNGVAFQVGVEMFYTQNLRQYDAGFLAVAHAVSDSLLIPPHSRDFKIEGRCSGECTEKSVPNEGVTVISVMLHAHLYAKKLKLRHFRGEMELPWLANDDKFSFKSHKMRPLFELRKILPGDTLVVECEYNTLSRGKVTIGGLSSTSEMCSAFLWYFPKLYWNDCSSEYPSNLLYNFLGYPSNAVNEGNRKNALNFSTFIDTQVKWTDEKRKDLQQILTGSSHRASCIIPQQNNRFADESNAAVRTVKPVVVDADKVYQPPTLKMRSINNAIDDEFRCNDKKKMQGLKH